MTRSVLKYLRVACRYLPVEVTRENVMKKFIWIGALRACWPPVAAVPTKCRSVPQSDGTTPPARQRSSSTTRSSTRQRGPSTTRPTSVEGSDDTITVSDFSDMPPKCIELLGTFLKKIEPTVSADRLGHGDARRIRGVREAVPGRIRLVRGRDDRSRLRQVQPQRLRREAVRTDGGARRRRGTGHARLHQLPAGRCRRAAPTATGDIPSDCAGTIAAIEPFLTKGETMKDLTIAEVTQARPVDDRRSAPTARPTKPSAFFARTDVTDLHQRLRATSHGEAVDDRLAVGSSARVACRRDTCRGARRRVLLSGTTTQY